MFDSVRSLWDSFWAIPHIQLYLTCAWITYLVGVGAWIALQKREPVATLSWLISLAALPYIGFVIYYLFGPQKIVRHRRRRQQRRPTQLLPAALSPEQESLELHALAQATTSIPRSTAQTVQLLVDGGNKYPALLADIAAARDHVHLEYYIYTPDRSGTALRDALVERARAGVSVRLLVDAMGSKKADRRFFAPLTAAGGEIAWFHPSRPWMLWKRPWVNLRTHRKIAVIDGRIGYLGGINITDEQDNRLRQDAYRDLHLRLEGQTVSNLQDVFIEDWVYATEQHDFVCQLAQSMPAPESGPIDAQLLTSGPDSDWEAIHRMFVGAIYAASQRVWLVTPYFVPGEAAMMALTSAALSGLDVRLLVPKMSDSRLTTWCVRSYYDELLAAGIKVHEYGPRMLHTKALLIDDNLAILGSANFDHRSFRLNFEIGVLFDDTDIAARLAALIEQDLRHAPQVCADRKHPLLTASLPEALARLMSPLL